MKKVLAITCALLVVLLASSIVMAAQDNWRTTIKADNNNGMYIGTSWAGIYPTSSDGYDAQDAAAQYLSDPLGQQFANWVTMPIEGRTEAFMKSIKAPVPTNDPSPRKSWDLRVYALKDATNTEIRLMWYCTQTTTAIAPPASFNGMPATYYLKMVNNRGVIGAPANGTTWIIPIPTPPLSTTVPYFTLVLPTGLGSGGPDIILSGPNYPEQALEEAYIMEYGFFVPEPGGLLALGTGLAGLVGFVARRRRA